MSESILDRHVGNYRLQRFLGRGSSSEIYLGEHELFHTQAAIKLLQEQANEQEREKFLAQAEVLSSLRHPHIVQVLDFGEQDHIAYLIMDYAPYGTLREQHPRGEVVPLETIAVYMKQVAPALNYLHQHRLIHRDVKPHNMLLTAHQHVLLNDFGTTVVSQSLDPIYASMYDFEGTVAYAAPEQLQGTPRRSSDQYALGVVVYEWLCGDWPFSGSFDEVVHQHLFVPAPSVCEKNTDLPPSIERAVMKALAKDPDERYPTIETFATTLLQALEQVTGPIQVKLPSPTPFLPSDDPITPLPLSDPPPTPSKQKRQFLSPFPFTSES